MPGRVPTSDADPNRFGRNLGSVVPEEEEIVARGGRQTARIAEQRASDLAHSIRTISAGTGISENELLRGVNNGVYSTDIISRSFNRIDEANQGLLELSRSVDVTGPMSQQAAEEVGNLLEEIQRGSLMFLGEGSELGRGLGRISQLQRRLNVSRINRQAASANIDRIRNDPTYAREILDQWRAIGDDPEMAADFVKNSMKPDFLDWIHWYRINNLLSSPVTTARNFLGGVTRGTLENLSALSEVPLTGVRSLITGEERTYLTSAMLRFMANTYSTFASAGVGARSFAQNRNLARRLDLPISGSRAISNPIGRAVAAVYETPLRLLVGGDAVIYNSTRMTELMHHGFQEAIRNGTHNPIEVWRYGLDYANRLKDISDDALEELPQLTREVVDAAQEVAARVTFTQDVPWLRQINRGLRAASHSEDLLTAAGGMAARFVTDMVIPFKQTPYNILKASVEFSPLNAGSLARLARVGGGPLIARSPARAVAGTGLLGGAWLLWEAGMLTGWQRSGDDAQEAALQRQRPDDSFGFGGLWGRHPSVIDPLSIGISAVAGILETVEQYEDDEDAVNAIGNTLALSLHLLQDRTFMQGIGELSRALQTIPREEGLETRTIARFGAGLTEQFIPYTSLLGNISRQMDPALTDVVSYWDYLMDGIPGMRGEQARRRTVYGDLINYERMLSDGTWGLFLATRDEGDLLSLREAAATAVNMINPVPVRYDNTNAVDQMLYDLRIPAGNIMSIDGVSIADNKMLSNYILGEHGPDLYRRLLPYARADIPEEGPQRAMYDNLVRNQIDAWREGVRSAVLGDPVWGPRVWQAIINRERDEMYLTDADLRDTDYEIETPEDYEQPLFPQDFTR